MSTIPKTKHALRTKEHKENISKRIREINEERKEKGLRTLGGRPKTGADGRDRTDKL